MPQVHVCHIIYSKMELYGISMEGLPDGKTLKHPSSYGSHTLKAILEGKESLQLKGMYRIPVTYPCTLLVDGHCFLLV